MKPLPLSSLLFSAIAASAAVTYNPVSRTFVCQQDGTFCATGSTKTSILITCRGGIGTVSDCCATLNDSNAVCSNSGYGNGNAVCSSSSGAGHSNNTVTYKPPPSYSTGRSSLPASTGSSQQCTCGQKPTLPPPPPPPTTTPCSSSSSKTIVSPPPPLPPTTTPCSSSVSTSTSRPPLPPPPYTTGVVSRPGNMTTPCLSSTKSSTSTSRSSTLSSSTTAGPTFTSTPTQPNPAHYTGAAAVLAGAPAAAIAAIAALAVLIV